MTYVSEDGEMSMPEALAHCYAAERAGVVCPRCRIMAADAEAFRLRFKDRVEAVARLKEELKIQRRKARTWHVEALRLRRLFGGPKLVPVERKRLVSILGGIASKLRPR